MNQIANALLFFAFVAIVFSPHKIHAWSLTPDLDAPEFAIITGWGGGAFLPSNEDGTFSMGTEVNMAGLGVDTADMDGDGDNDILFASYGGPVLLLTNDGSGSYNSSIVTEFRRGSATWFGSTYLRTGDFNEDGRYDFVVGDMYLYQGAYVFLQEESGSFSKVELDLGAFQPPNYSTYKQLSGIGVGDIDGDGYEDILALYGEKGAVYLFKGDGTGAMASPVFLFSLHEALQEDMGLPYPTSPTGFALFDLEGDGDLDAVVGGGFRGDVGSSHFLLINDGKGNYTLQSPESVFESPPSIFKGGPEYSFIDSSDFDHDGDHDLIIAGYGSREIEYIENLGGILAPPIVIHSRTTGVAMGVGAPPLFAPKSRNAAEMLNELSGEVLSLPVDMFSNSNQTNALHNKLTAILDDLNAIDENTLAADKLDIYQTALDKLKNDILKKTDGFYGGSLKNDWVITQEGQEALYPKVSNVIKAVEAEIAKLL